MTSTSPTLDTHDRKGDRRVAIVTGISKGFGLAVARDLASRGWIVVGNARSERDLADATYGRERIIGVSGDLQDDQHARALVEVARQQGSVELLVNNAGTLGPSPLPSVLTLAMTDLADIFAINTLAQVRLIQLAFETGAPAVIINVSSDAGREAYEGWGGYGASKAALDHLTAVLAIENPSSKFYSLDPGDLRTDMHQRAFPGEDISDRPLPEIAAPAVSALAQGTLPSGRYLASDLPGDVAPSG